MNNSILILRIEMIGTQSLFLRQTWDKGQERQWIRLQYFMNNTRLRLCLGCNYTVETWQASYIINEMMVSWVSNGIQGFLRLKKIKMWVCLEEGSWTKVQELAATLIVRRLLSSLCNSLGVVAQVCEVQGMQVHVRLLQTWQ